MPYRMLIVAAAWAITIVAITGIGMLLLQFRFRHFDILLPTAVLATVAGAIYVPLFTLAQRLVPNWRNMAKKILAGLFLGLLLSLISAALLMYFVVDSGGVKGHQPSMNFLTYLIPTLFLVLVCAVVGAATPVRLLFKTKACAISSGT